MKVTVTVSLEGGLQLTATHDVNTLADVKRLGSKLVALPTGANKIMPGLKDREVRGMGIDESANGTKKGTRARSKNARRSKHAGPEGAASATE